MIIDDVNTDEIWELIDSSRSKIDYFDYTTIPERLMENIKNYVDHGEMLGGFLYSVFCNDLFEATAHADDYNLFILPTYVKYIYNNCPTGCHGSYEIVEAWLQKKHKERQSQNG